MDTLAASLHKHIALTKEVSRACDLTIHGEYDKSNAVLARADKLLQDYTAGLRDAAPVPQYERGDLP